jgi:DNA-directed RNA polymerase subunit omega
MMMKIEHDVRGRTAGLTSEHAVKALGNRYDLVLVASQRVRELRRGYAPKVATKYGAMVTAILEIEEGLVGNEYLLKETSEDRHRQKQQQTYSR